MAEFSALHAKWLYEMGEMSGVSPSAVQALNELPAAPSTYAPALSLSALLPLASVHWVFARRIALAGGVGRACPVELCPDTRRGWLKKLQAELRLWLRGLRGAGR